MHFHHRGRRHRGDGGGDAPDPRDRQAELPGEPLTPPGELRLVRAADCTLHRGPTGQLRFTLTGQFSCARVHLRRLRPLSEPDGHLSICEADGAELAVLADPGELAAEQQAMVREELDFYYAVPRVREVRSIADESGMWRWLVVTDRGEREFYVKGRSENLRTSGDRLFVTDIENCRYEIGPPGELSVASQRELNKVL